MVDNNILEIKKFLEGENEDLKYVVNVQANKYNNKAECIIHKPDGYKCMETYTYTPFLFVKNFKKHDLVLYDNNKDLIKLKLEQYGITFTKLKTENQKRLENGYSYKVSSNISFNAILNFYKDGGVDIYEKQRNDKGRLIKDKMGNHILNNRKYFNYVSPEEQFFIDKKVRLFKGIDYYDNLHRLVFDIETQGLRPSINRIFAIALKDNFGFEKLLKVNENDNDEEEKKLIVDFFEIITELKPAVIAGYNLEEFDFDFILKRAEILGVDLTKLKTTLNDKSTLRRNHRATVKIGGDTLRYTSTIMWGFTVIDIMHAVKKTAAINNDIKEFGLKYICKFEEVAKENRMYISGDDNGIYHIWRDNKIHFINPQNNNYIIIPDEFQDLGLNLYKLQNSKEELNLGDEDYKKIRNGFLKDNTEFVQWFKDNCIENNYIKLISGKEILERYVLDDVWETEKIDALYNQSSFLLAKLIPTTYYRICTMGTASIWNLLMTAWSFNNNIAIPESDEKVSFSGGLSRCFKKGYNENVIKIDFASLYPMIQLTYDVFPVFDITNIIKKMLSYFTTTRNVYKKMANGDSLNENELNILKLNKFEEIIKKYEESTLTDGERRIFKTLQLPIKILNNSLFGALGSGYSFNWSDNICAGRITTVGRLELRKVIVWFQNFGCKPLLCVTDGVNFAIPKTTRFIVNNNSVQISDVDLNPDEAWVYGGKTGVSALIVKFNDEVKLERENSFISIDDDGQFDSCLNLKRNNYTLLINDKKKNKKKVKLIGGMIKSKVMPDYIEEFIDNALIIILEGRGFDFIEYYNSYCEDIFYRKIPLEKIASKRRVKESIKDYINRGTDKNGRAKAKKAHMELIILEREKLAKELFVKHFDIIKDKYSKQLEKYDNYDVETIDIDDIYDFVVDWIPNEPELDSMMYLVNTGYKISDGDSNIIKDVETGKERMASQLISKKDLEGGLELNIDYNVDKYLSAFNKKVIPLLEAFNSEIKDKIIVKIKKKRYKDEFGNKRQSMELVKNVFSNSELNLEDCDLDNIEEALTLSKEEIEFWNKYGYNPDVIWDGYTVPENTLRTDIYDTAYNYLSEQLKSTNKKLKRVDDIREVGDLILFKTKNQFDVGFFNGVYVKMIREDVQIPNIEKLNFKDIVYQYEKEFREKFGISEDLDLTDIFNGQPKALQAYEDLVIELMSEEGYVDDIYDDYNF